MKSFLLLISIAIISLTLTAQTHEREDELTYRKGELIVLLHQDCKADDLVKSNQSAGLKSIRQISPAMNLWLMSYDPAQIAGEEAKNLIGKSSCVKIVQFNHKNINLKSNTPNDSLFAYQWDMSITSAPEAWSIDTGGFTRSGTPIVIASIDGGFDMSHPDLNPWHNPYEIPGNGIDDDHNGYIDDYHGWNTSLSNDSITLGTGHGTSTMGISSAHGNNTIGIAGVNWNVQAMPIVTDIYDETSVIAAYTYVFAQRKLYNQTNGTKGAFIVSTNSSFGPSGYGYQYPLWNAMYDSLGSVGILNAGATSNDPTCDVDTCPDIPSQCPSNYTVIVTGTNSADTRHGGYGPHNVDLAAPGNGSYTITTGGGYSGFGGTSAASPHVAGAIALMWSAACPKMLDDYKLYPDSMSLIMKNYLLTGVDTLPALIGMVASNGRLDLFKALTNVQKYDCVVTTGIKDVSGSDIRIYPNPSNNFVTINSPEGVESIRLYDELGQRFNVTYTDNAISIDKLAPGVYTIQITDKSNHTVTERIARQ